MKTSRNVFKQLQLLATEQLNKRSADIDALSIPKILTIINAEDQNVAKAVKKEIKYIAKAVRMVVQSLRNGGRLIYVGAGTSGRLGILDAVECPPTYGTNPSMIQGIIAGGKRAVFRSQEGAEDKESEGRCHIKSLRVKTNDVVCGIAASARTPYVIAALKESKKRGARTIYITTNPRSVLREKALVDVLKYIDVAICPAVGAEVIMGSTRMKSGTAQKLVLNMITTAAMIRLGKVYKNLMVDLKMNSKKLEERAKRILMLATGVDYTRAANVLYEADGQVKTAIVMLKAGVSAKLARQRLKKAKGFVRKAI